MKKYYVSRVFGLLLGALLLSLIVPLAASGQGRWYRGRSHNRQIVISTYRPRPYVLYRTRPYDYRPRLVYHTWPDYDRYQTPRYWYPPVYHRRHYDGLRFHWRR